MFSGCVILSLITGATEFYNVLGFDSCSPFITVSLMLVPGRSKVQRDVKNTRERKMEAKKEDSM